MKKVFALLLILIMTVSLFACGEKGTESLSGTSGTLSASDLKIETEASNDESGADTASQDKQEGTVTIEIAPPDGWTKNEGSVLPVHYMKGTASLMVKEEPFGSATLDDVVSEALGIYQKSFDNFKVQGEVEPFTVDEKDARKLTFTCAVGNINMKYLYVYLFAADKTYVIMFGDQESTFDTLTADYETILNDIRFKA